MRAESVPEGDLAPGGGNVNIPTNISYMVSIPWIFKFLPPLLKNMLIYGSMIVPPMKIRLSIENKPE